MNWLLPIALQGLAFAVAMAEIVVPSFGLLSALCLGLLGYSWYLIVTTLAGAAIPIFIAADIALIPLGFFLGIRLIGKSPLSHRSDMGQGTGMEDGDQRLQALVGLIAVVEARLRPSGKIKLNEEIYEALSSGEFLEQGTKARVVAVQNGTLLVEPVNG